MLPALHHRGEEAVGCMQTRPELKILSRVQRDVLRRKHLVAWDQPESAALLESLVPAMTRA